MRTLAKTMSYEAWPELPYEEFKPTAHLLHMCLQVIGKLKLTTPFEPEWANVPLWLTSRGLTTGPIPYENGVFSIDVDLIDHQILCMNSTGGISKFKLGAMSVAQFYKKLFEALSKIDIKNITINLMPQEISNPVPFDIDTQKRPYEAKLANAWWQIMLHSYRVMQRYHARFNGKTPPIGLMWGTFDLRDARYKGAPIAATGANAGYLRRNAMDQAQVEAGWWSGTDAYPKPAYFSFTYPQPEGIELVKIKPLDAHWDKSMGEFILDYDDVRLSKHPEQDLFAFLESTYKAGAERAGWDKKLITPGYPV